jgi:hypothetical protein
MSQDTASQPHSRGSSGRRIAAFVAAGVVGLAALGLVIAGGVLLWGNAQKDDAGYISTGTHGLHTSTYAIATDNLDVDLDVPGGVVDRDRFGHVRVQATSRTGKPVFVGIAPTREVSGYLAASAHASVTDVEDGPFQAFHVTYRHHGGDRRPSAPAEQHFWAASAHGDGAQSATWKVREGNWSVVVMNADGSAGVDAGVNAGADLPFLAPAGWISLGGGLVLLAAAGGLLFLGMHTPPPTAPGRADAPRPAVVVG